MPFPFVKAPLLRCGKIPSAVATGNNIQFQLSGNYMNYQKSFSGAAYFRELQLQTRWPSRELRAVFRAMLSVYRESARKLAGRGKPATWRGMSALLESFSSMCASLTNAKVENQPAPQSSTLLADALTTLRKIHKHCYPQAVASALAMILHCDPRSRHATNTRRPRISHSTFPNSPGLSRLLADQVIAGICTLPLPNKCHSMRQARSFVKKALKGRVLDPSMESGQLLLAVAESWRQTVLIGLPHQSDDAHRLIQAGWEKLCDDLLWGVDRNPLAAIAVGHQLRHSV